MSDLEQTDRSVEKKKNMYEVVAHLMPQSTSTMDMILALFARHELCTDPSFHEMLKEIEIAHQRSLEKKRRGKVIRNVDSTQKKKEEEM